jgi:hypothetical protein
MTERDKEYYNQKISELYAVIENQEKIIRDLQEEVKGYQTMYFDKVMMVNKTIEYIEKNTMYFDSEYAKDYGELCPIAGAGDTRIHCVIGDK